MSKRALQTLPPPADRAMIFICQKCGKRAGGSYKQASYELASNLKSAAKRKFVKGDVRVVLTNCMKVCPTDAITVCIQMQQILGRSTYLQAPVDDLEGASEAVLERIKET
jgi:predicted metal-binding protein